MLFNDLSGSTHLLSSTAVWLIERLAATPDDIPGLAAALQAELAAEATLDDELTTEVDLDQLADLIADLHSLDLLQPC